ncbi:phosphoenolpyruvate synthase [Candidatus Microgenomates bacterium]|nr:phosphoenolpyruvate synthase [Candidatus Microgenomates bacterium]
MVKKYVVSFSEVDKEDVGLVGGKGANLGEMSKAKFPVPPGFIVTAHAYYYFLKENNLLDEIKRILKSVDVDKPDQLNHVSLAVKKLIVSSPIPHKISKLIAFEYAKLAGLGVLDVAVRSSATAEDLPSASFAGQQETYLNVSGETNVILKVRECWASLFEARAIFYRAKNNFDHFKVGIACVIQKMIQSEASGIMFTIDPVTNDKTKIVVESILGLGELIVQGAVTPDHYEVSKDNLKINNKVIGLQDRRMIKYKNGNKTQNLSPQLKKNPKVSDNLILQVAKLGKLIEKHYYFPQDIEWAIEKNKVYIVQSRPITTISATENKKEDAQKIEALIEHKLKTVLAGQPASPGIASGPAKVIHSAKELNRIKNGDILVTTMTNPDYVPGMKRACAVVTDEGGRTAHAAIVSRELGIPAVVGSKEATRKLKTGLVYTVDGSKGIIYAGGLPNEARKIVDASILNNSYSQRDVTTPKIKTATKIYVNLAEPEKAKEIAQKNVDGVGLLRAEFMISQIGKHPKYFIHQHKEKEYVSKLVEGLKTFAESFSPRPVIYRATDFKTNEYRNLIGGKDYEPQEPNPMLGYRGCFRYIHDPKVFALEIEAIKTVRNKHGFKNLWLMIPFVRTVKELIEVKSLLHANGLARSSNFKLLMMVEIPSNVILLEKFIEAGIDGVSIGSNDLTMLILGTDRDNSEVAEEYDERNEAVLWALERIVKTCLKKGITASICGQAPSDYPDLTEKLVAWGITSISVNPDVIDLTREIVAAAENKLLKK